MRVVGGDVCGDNVEAHCSCVVASGKLILISMYVVELIDQYQLIAGCFSRIDLCQLCTRQVCLQLMKAYVAKASCNHLLLFD